jgi:hypothetical protein
MHDTTFLGLHAWSKSLFEKLGWMVLAAKDKQTHNQIKCYVESIENLVDHIDVKLDYLGKLCKKNVSIEPHFHDMKILKENVLTLHKHAKTLLKKNNK